METKNENLTPEAQKAIDALRAIKADLKKFNMAHFIRDGLCGTTMCFGGWVAKLNGAEYEATEGMWTDETGEEISPDVYARRQLGFTHEESNYFFYSILTDMQDQIGDSIGSDNADQQYEILQDAVCDHFNINPETI